MKSIIAFSLAVVLLACQDPKPVPQPSDTSCAAACQKMVTLGCVEAKTPDGHPCSEVCEHIQASGFVSWHTDCIVSNDVSSCADIKRCRELP